MPLVIVLLQTSAKFSYRTKGHIHDLWIPFTEQSDRDEHYVSKASDCHKRLLLLRHIGCHRRCSRTDHLQLGFSARVMLNIRTWELFLDAYCLKLTRGLWLRRPIWTQCTVFTCDIVPWKSQKTCSSFFKERSPVACSKNCTDSINYKLKCTCWCTEHCAACHQYYIYVLTLFL